MPVTTGPALIPLALATGAAATFNPCGIGLLPSYVGYLVGQPAAGRPGAAAIEGVAVGLAMTAGLLLLYLPIALVFGAIAAAVGSAVRDVGLLVGMLLALWGAGILLWPERLFLSLPAPHPAGGARGLAGACAYGLAFGLASLGCTFPLFVSLFFQSAASGSAAGGAAVVLAYAGGMGATVTVLSVLARLAQARLQRLLVRSAAAGARLAGLLTLLSGAYVLAYWLRAAP